MPCQEQNTTTPVAEHRPGMFFKKQTWAEMALDDDEEEELEILREKENNLKNILAARRFLYNIGQYELEDGEILE